MCWLVGYLPQIASDLSVFHRVDDQDGIPVSRWTGLAELLPFYNGAVRAKLTAEMVAQQPAPTTYESVGQSAFSPASEPVRRTQDAAALARMTKNNQGFPSIGYRGRDGKAV